MQRLLKSQSLSTQEVQVHTHQDECWVQTTYERMSVNIEQPAATVKN